MSQLNSLIKGLEDASAGIQKTKIETLDKIQYDKFVKWARIILWSVTGIIVTLVVTNILIMFCTLYWRCCLGMNCLSKLLMTLKMTLGGLISTVSITYMIIAILSSNFCGLFKESMEDRNVLKKLLPEGIYTFADNCIYKDSKGDLSFLGGDTLKGFTENLKGLDDIDKFKEVADSVKNLDEPATIKKYRTEYLAGLNTFETIDTLPPGEDFTSNLNNLNTKSQAIVSTDSFRLNAASCPAGAKKSAKADGVSESKGQNYCIIIPEFNSPTIDARYTPRTEANQPYSSMKKCVESHNTLTTEMITLTDPVTGPTNGLADNGKKLITDIKASITDVTEISNQLR